MCGVRVDDLLAFLRGGGDGESESVDEPVTSEEELGLNVPSEDEDVAGAWCCVGASEGGGGVAAGRSGATVASPGPGSPAGAALVASETVYCDWTSMFGCLSPEL